MTPILTDLPAQGLFTWSGGPRSSGVGFFCFHALEDTKQKKPTPLDRGPPLHVNRVLMFSFLLPENCQYPFVPLFRLLNVFAGTYFLVYDLLTPFSYACLMLIYIAEKNRSPVRLLVHFATLITTTDFDFSHLVQLLADSDSETPGFQWHRFTRKIFLGQYNYTRPVIYITLYLPQKSFVVTKKKVQMLKFENST